MSDCLIWGVLSTIDNLKFYQKIFNLSFERKNLVVVLATMRLTFCLVWE